MKREINEALLKGLPELESKTLIYQFCKHNMHGLLIHTNAKRN